MINKEGWEKKRFDEVFNLQMGKTPNRNNLAYWKNGIYNWISIADLKGEKFISKTKEQISEIAIIESGIKPIPANTVIMSFKLSIGKTAITTNQIYSNEAIMAFYLKNDYVIIPDFLNFYLRNYSWGSNNRAVMGETLNKATISAKKITIPPLPIQQQIVTELDTLSEIITKKKQQLAELDNLAQATFYNMFGDPVSNEKGWEIDSIVNVAPVKAFKGNVESFEGKYWLLNLDMIESNTGNIISVNLVEKKEIGNSTVVFSEENVLYSKLRPYLNKVIIPFSSGYATSELLPLLPKKNVLDKTFLVQLLRSKFFVGFIQEKVAGAKMPRVSMDIFRAFQIILPPITLQTQFAEKINAIEKQKELIKKSISDTQLLFDYTMDKYFN